MLIYYFPNFVLVFEIFINALGNFLTSSSASLAGRALLVSIAGFVQGAV